MASNSQRDRATRSRCLVTITRLEEEIKQANSLIEEMREELFSKDRKIEVLERRCGITQRREWDVRSRRWWLIWLRDHDTDAYEILMRTIHQTLMFGVGIKELFQAKSNFILKERKKELITLPNSPTPFTVPDGAARWSEGVVGRVKDFPINIYGIKFVSSHARVWDEDHQEINIKKREIRCPSIDWLSGSIPKKELIESCKTNNINIKSSWNKYKIIEVMLNHDKKIENEKKTINELTLEELKEIIRKKEIETKQE